ncbi:MAG: hypothetical protein CUN55_10035 [Phototrophicales bacterium]|nr:MAG: hypothetical protein CUN55_10035 [Phototrophicales bacterium]
MSNKRRSVFFEEWQDCLYAHYLHVIQTGDEITQPTLEKVLVEAGISLAEIKKWHSEAESSEDTFLVSEPTESQIHDDVAFIEVPEVDNADLLEQVEAEPTEEQPTVEEGEVALVEESSTPSKPQKISQMSLFGE